MNIMHSTREDGGMIVREKVPVNLEMPFGSMESFLTPVRRYFVRCHNPLPTIDIGRWRLRIFGNVAVEREWSYDELLEMETETRTVTMECAGNGRAFLEPQRSGAQWEGGAVGTAEWAGIPLRTLLEHTGVREESTEVILEGADKGEIKTPPRPDGEIHYSRSLSISKANKDALLAVKMNGEPLTAEHGFPLRAVVPGWYGMASVKWLTNIVVSKEKYYGFYQTIDYSYWEKSPSAQTLVPITEMRVKAQIARPEFAEAVPAGSTYRVRGAAWTSDAGVSKVELSVDRGASWHVVRLLGESITNAWRLWEHDWAVPGTPGKTVLMARATDSRGRTQPPEHHDDRGSYLIHHWLPVDVFIE